MQVFSAGELRSIHAKIDKGTYLAGRWAAKEAFIKAWSNTLFMQEPPIKEEELNWAEIEVEQDRWGRTRINTRGTVAEKIGRRALYPVSISHDGDYAIAVVQWVQ